MASEQISQSISAKRNRLKEIAMGNSESGLDGMTPSLRSHYMQRYVGHTSRVVQNLENQEPRVQEVYVKRIDTKNHIMYVRVGDRNVEVNLYQLDQEQFYRTLVLFENATANTANSRYSVITPYEDIVELPEVEQEVCIETDEYTLIGTCRYITENVITIEGTETTFVNGVRTQREANTTISTEDFRYYGRVISNESQNLPMDSAKPSILGDLTTLEEISEFLTTAELSIEERMQINDYLKYRKTKPTEWRDINDEEYNKVRFVDGMVATAINTQVRPEQLLELTGIEFNSTNALTNLEELTRFAKDALKHALLTKQQLKTAKGTLLNLNSSIQLEGKLTTNLTDAEYSILLPLVFKLLEGKELDSYTTAYDLAAGALEEIDELIATTKEQQLKDSYIKVKNAIGVFAQAYFDIIDTALDEEYVVEVESNMRRIVNRTENGEERGPVKMVMINGFTGAGKGTTLGMLNAKASESGTDGIAGRGEGFEQYEQVMQPYDAARFAGEYIPNRLMRLLFATDIVNQRINLDMQGRTLEPVYVSGFPRAVPQAKLFDGVEGIKAVSLNISEETAVFRTVRRMVEFTLKGRKLRGDDLSDLTFADSANGTLSAEYLMPLIEDIIQRHNITDINMVNRDIVAEITSQLILSEKARYKKYKKDKPNIESALETLGVHVYQINGDELTPAEVTEITRDYITGNIEA